MLRRVPDDGVRLVLQPVRVERSFWSSKSFLFFIFFSSPTKRKKLTFFPSFFLSFNHHQTTNRGSAASQKSYPYRGVNNFCDTSVQDAVAFDKASPPSSTEKGSFVPSKNEEKASPTSTKYVWVSGGADGLREALLTKGPMTVSVDASPEDFALYSSGIYNNSRCEEKLSRLDHAVVVSGYGEDFETKQKFWIVKNTWSVRWGEAGYLRIAVAPDDCGISSQPLYLELGGVRELL